MAEAAISRPRKKGAQEGKTSAFVDESGVQLLPAVERTYAPVGKTPILTEQATRDHLSTPGCGCPPSSPARSPTRRRAGTGCWPRPALNPAITAQ